MNATHMSSPEDDRLNKSKKQPMICIVGYYYEYCSAGLSIVR